MRHPSHPTSALAGTLAAATLAAFTFTAQADDMKLKTPTPEVFGNEPAHSITPKPVVAINTMTEVEMRAHAAIGAQHAGRVMASRPYNGLEDFRARSGLPEWNYEQLKPMLDF